VSFIIDEDNYLQHYGILRKSGRYPWGSGGDTTIRSGNFLEYVTTLRKQGMSDLAIVKKINDEMPVAFYDPKNPFTTTKLRATTSIARNQKRAADISMAQRLKDKGYSNSAIAERMNLAGESSVRALLEPGALVRTDQLQATANMLKDQVTEKGYVDVGVGVEHHRGLSRTQLDTALSMLESEGYTVTKVQIDQLGTGNKTTLKVLGPPGTTYKDVVTNKDKIRPIDTYTNDGTTYEKVRAPLSMDSKRIGIRYAEDGGADADGVIYVRPGVKDVALGGSQYAQVRIAVDGTHYLKGMAVYKDGLPDGVDLQFNTNKSNTGNKLDVMKKMNTTPDGKLDIENPFGASIKPGGQRGVMNIVNEEGDWATWSKNLASQMLSKQKPTFAEEQLGKTYRNKKKELDEILALTNPAVKRELLRSFADDADSSAVHLKAAHLNRQATQVILPVSKMKDTEIYAPNFRNGERVALVRYPHGGTFEIPELTVNNRQPDAIALLGKTAKDAVGINPKVAERLSGADFDGDTVLVIPNNSGKIKSTPALDALKGFDPKVSYPAYEGMPSMSPKKKQTEMGKVSNLITDMTIKGANTSEIARAVKHSMVVIDAEKHNLNYRQSAIDNGIAQLKQKYQGGADKGATTLISRASRETSVPHRKQSYSIDPETGEKVYKYTGEGYVQRKVLKDGTVREKFVERKTKTTEGAEAKDAHTLSSGTPIERVYADHANRLKALANAGRKEMLSVKSIPYSPSAKEVYSKEVATLNAKLNLALRNAPRERQAQLLANAVVKQKRDANPDMQGDELKKISARELIKARARTGAGKPLVDITDTEWEAIQAGAISNNKLTQILNNSDLDKLKQLATPRQPTVMTSSKQLRAKQLIASGRTPSEVADILGVSVSTLTSSLK
jgi:DNA-binding CsgD family transcriptional regulator